MRDLGEPGREVVVSTSAHVWGGGRDEEGFVALWGKGATKALSDVAVLEWSGAVVSPLPFAVAAWIVPSAGAPCAQVVNFINRERWGRR